MLGYVRLTRYEKGETQSFYNEFFEVFGVRRRTVASYKAHVAKRYPNGFTPRFGGDVPRSHLSHLGPGKSR